MSIWFYCVSFQNMFLKTRLNIFPEIVTNDIAKVVPTFCRNVLKTLNTHILICVCISTNEMSVIYTA